MHFYKEPTFVNTFLSDYFPAPRAYVEFFRTCQDSGVLPEVSLALLLAQQSPPLKLSVYPIEQIEKCAGNRNITHMKYARYGSIHLLRKPILNISFLPI